MPQTKTSLRPGWTNPGREMIDVIGAGWPFYSAANQRGKQRPFFLGSSSSTSSRTGGGGGNNNVNVCIGYLVSVQRRVNETSIPEIFL